MRHTPASTPWSHLEDEAGAESGRAPEPGANEAMSEQVEVSRSRTRADAEQRALVLAAAGIGCRLLPGDGEVRLYVAADEAERARFELWCFDRENARRSTPTPKPQGATYGVEAALAYCAVLMFFFAADRREALSIDWSAAGAAQAGLILDGAWWRTVTALSLHADLAHLLGNMAFGVVTGLLVAQLLGSGLAWLAILLAGALGNALNAAFQAGDHTAVGASTGVFGAVGILSGYARRSRVVPWQGGIRRWAPVGAGLMLLAFLGFGGGRTDVWAHVAGFATGGVIGFALAHAGNDLQQGAQAQRTYGVLACSLFALAWLLALGG